MGCNMSPALVRSVGFVLIWGAALVGALSIADWPGNWGHGVCGLWGCGPPLQTLVACHLSWLVFLVPPALWGRVLLHARQRAIVGWLAIGGSAVGLLGVAVYEWMTWWIAASDWQREFFWNRVGFSIVTQIDLPFLELLVAGIVMVWLQLQSSRSASRLVSIERLAMRRSRDGAPAVSAADSVECCDSPEP